ncbi:MAG: helix-turn-helix transcriptional regulator [Clostridiales bacterium]|nr:helix-turn-helix transcriptional regulator [Clostridiales bacterium]
MMDFAEKLKALRKGKNYSQQQLAEKLFVSSSLISSYEQDLRMPSLEMLVKLSHEFGVSTDYLLNLDRQKTINVEKLTDHQIAVVSEIVNEFLNLNNTKDAIER